MNKVYFNLSDLSREELQKVFDENEKLQEMAYERMRDNADFWIGEYIDSLRDALKNWEIGEYGYSFVHLKTDESNRGEQWQALESTQNMFYFFSEEDFALVERWFDSYGRWIYAWGNNDENWKNWLDEKKNEIERIITSRLTSEYEVTRERAFEEFADIMIEEFEDIKIDTKYKAYRHTPEHIIYERYDEL